MKNLWNWIVRFWGILLEWMYELPIISLFKPKRIPQSGGSSAEKEKKGVGSGKTLAGGGGSKPSGEKSWLEVQEPEESESEPESPSVDPPIVLPSSKGGLEVDKTKELSGLLLDRKKQAVEANEVLRQLLGRDGGLTSRSTLKDTVRCSVYAPDKVEVAQEFLLMVFAHLKEEEEEVKETAHLFDERLKKKAFKSLNKQVERGSQIGFRIEAKGMVQDGNVRQFSWQGEMNHETFVLKIPKDYSSKFLIGTVYMSIDSIPAGQISFKINIGQQTTTNKPADTNATSYRTAFISYSSKDRDEVLRRTQMLPKVGLIFFQDLLSLEPGQLWEKQLYKHIDECDVFFLFWSQSASDSKWVQKEWEYALDRQNNDPLNPPAIIPVPLEGPPLPPVPAPLSHLHFNDTFVYFIQDN